MRNKTSLIGVAWIILSLIVITLSAPVVAQERSGWLVKIWEPDMIFRHFWNGTLLGTENGFECWELYTEIRMMMTSLDGNDDFEWVRMTIMWDSISQAGEIVKFEHHGINMRFTGWIGSIEYNGLNTDNNQNEVYHFQASGLGHGLYRTDEMWCNLYIRGIFEGIYYPDNSENPLEGGLTVATESATLKIGCGSPVGGELQTNTIIPTGSLLIAVISATAITLGVAVRKRKLF